MFFVGFLFFFKYDRLIFMLIGVEFLFFSLIVWLSYNLEVLSFFYFLSFGLISSVTGLVVFFFAVKCFGYDKVLFYDFKMLSLILVLDVLS